MKLEKRKDRLTGEEFQPKRYTQWFVRPANRIKFWNDQQGLIRAERREHDTALGKNLRIIKELLKGGKEARFTKEFMKGKGFSFLDFSNVVEHEGRLCYAVYGYLWMQEVDSKNVATAFIKIIKS